MSEELGELTAAERRLVALLLLLGQDAGAGDASLTERVMRGVRLHFATRGFIRAAGSLAAAVVDGLALVFGKHVRGGERA